MGQPRLFAFQLLYGGSDGFHFDVDREDGGCVTALADLHWRGPWSGVRHRSGANTAANVALPGGHGSERFQAEQLKTGSLGYFGNAEFLSETIHLKKTDPRSDVMTFAFTHVAHKPAFRLSAGLSGRTSAKMKPSRSTMSPAATGMGFEKTGESYTNV